MSFCQWEAKMWGSDAGSAEGAERPEWGSGPGARWSWRPLSRRRCLGVYSARQRMDSLRGFGVSAHPVSCYPGCSRICQRWSSRSRSAATMTSSPRMRPHSSKPLLDSAVEPLP